MTDDKTEALETNALELLQGQKWAEALAVLAEMARARPLSAGMLHNKAVCHAMLKQFHQARWDLRQVLRQKPGYERSVALLKEIQREIGRMPPGLSQREEARVRDAAAAAAKDRPQHVEGPKAAGRPKDGDRPQAAEDAKAATAVVRFRCGKCGARLEESSALSGQQVPCPACGGPCDVPHRKPRGKVILIAVSCSLAAAVLIGIVATILLNPDLLTSSKPAAPAGPASRPEPTRAGATVPPTSRMAVPKPAPPARPTLPATRPSTRPARVGPATKPATRPSTRPVRVTPATAPATRLAKIIRPATSPAATTRPATQPTSKPVATTQPASRPASATKPARKPAASRPASAPASAPATDA